MKKILPLIILSLLIFTDCKKESTPVLSNDTTYISYLALGDSYTIGESVAVSERYPMILSEEIKKYKFSVSNGPVILARTGWTTNQLKLHLQYDTAINSKKYDIVSLLIGVNNQYQGLSLEEYKVQFRQLLLSSIDLANGRKDKVFVISIPDYGYTPYGQSNQPYISSQIDLFNAANKHIVDSIGVKYFDITPISRNGLSDPSLVANDGLHPSGKMYRQWVEMMVSEVVEIIKK